MIWRLIALLGASTFIYTGGKVIFDEECTSVDFSGGRAVLLTCYLDNSGAISGDLAGGISLLIGITLIFISLNPWIVQYLKKSQTNLNGTVNNKVQESYSSPIGEISNLRKPSDLESIRICPYCAEEVRVEAIKCKHCGSSILKREFDTNLLVAVIAFTVFIIAVGANYFG